MSCTISLCCLESIGGLVRSGKTIMFCRDDMQTKITLYRLAIA